MTLPSARHEEYSDALHVDITTSTHVVDMHALHQQCSDDPLHVHRLQLPRNLWDSPGFLEFVPGPRTLNKLFRSVLPHVVYV